MRSLAKTAVFSFILSIAFYLGIVALGAQPAAAKCPPGTLMQQGSNAIDTGATVPGTGSTTTCLSPGKIEHVTAPKLIPCSHKLAYGFLFWDINSHLYTRPSVLFKAPSSGSFSATAWYKESGCGCTGPGCGGTSNVYTYGFEVDKNMRLKGTPIASVTPSSAWTAGSQEVFTKSAVTITAVNPVELIYWRIFPPAAATAKGKVLSAGMGATALAVAFYGPNPCTYISPPAPGELGPGASVAAYQAAAKYDIEQYNECIVRHGGTPPTP